MIKHVLNWWYLIFVFFIIIAWFIPYNPRLKSQWESLPKKRADVLMKTTKIFCDISFGHGTLEVFQY